MRRVKLEEPSGNRKIKLGNTLLVIITHSGAIAALFMWSWPAVITAAVLYWIAGSLGIGMGFHRLLTHRGYRVPKPLEYFLVTCGTLAAQGGPIQWVTTHRIHHAHTDQEGDPHTPRDGRWWSHVGWVLIGTGQDHDPAIMKRYSPDLFKDRYYVWLLRFHYVPVFVVSLSLLLIAGWRVFFWATFLRLTLELHATWFVNSATHIWGRRRFETNEDSKNSLWVALISFGEGWHNNHHAHPTSARHGVKWYEFDVNWIGIRCLQVIGLARGVKYIRFDERAKAWQLSGETRARRNLAVTKSSDSHANQTSVLC